MNAAQNHVLEIAISNLLKVVCTLAITCSQLVLIDGIALIAWACELTPSAALNFLISAHEKPALLVSLLGISATGLFAGYVFVLKRIYQWLLKRLGEFLVPIGV